MIWHITPRAHWTAALAAGSHAPASLATEGFIHCSTSAQVLRVANERFAGRTGLVLLEIDPARVTSEIRYEAGGFPHLYGPLDVAAVVAVHRFEEPFALPGS